MHLPSLLLAGLLLACNGAAEAGGGVVYGTVVRAYSGTGSTGSTGGTGSAGSSSMRQPMANLTVLMACPGFAARPSGRPAAEAKALTDTRGGFTLFSPSPGASGCQIRATDGRRTGAPIDIFISPSSLKYEFEVDADLNLSQR